MKLLHIDSSILGDDSVSRSLSSEIVETLRSQRQDIEVTYHDLAKNPLGDVNSAYFAALQDGAAAEAKASVDTGIAALETFKAAEVIVIGAPMYNFTIPTQLKAWVDRICVAGHTFRYTAKGPEGLSGGKKVIVALSRGGIYKEGTPMGDFEHQESYLKILFNFLGITDLTFIRAEGVAMGPEKRKAALEKATETIKQLTL